MWALKPRVYFVDPLAPQETSQFIKKPSYQGETPHYTETIAASKNGPLVASLIVFIVELKDRTHATCKCEEYSCVAELRKNY